MESPFHFPSRFLCEFGVKTNFFFNRKDFYDAKFRKRSLRFFSSFFKKSE